jgi:hypothetical protein
MAKHSLSLTAEQLKVTSKDIEIRVHVGDTKEILGTLKVSKGSIDWRDGYDQMSHVLRWENFAQLAKEHGTKRKKR